MTYGQYESFGESAVLEEGTRSASVITNMYTELLVLTKHDLLTYISQAARDSLEETLKQHRPEEELLRYQAPTVTVYAMHFCSNTVSPPWETAHGRVIAPSTRLMALP